MEYRCPDKHACSSPGSASFGSFSESSPGSGSSCADAAYQYDALTRRVVTATAAGTREFYFNNQWRPIEERVSSAVAAQYVWNPADRWDLIRRRRPVAGAPDEIRFVLRDHLDPAAIINESGVVTERFRYDAFGPATVLAPDFSARAASGCAWNFLYHAEFIDAETGLYNYGFRYYHPDLGRWISRDPIGEEGGLNLYGFVGNNGISRNDRFGLASHYTDCTDEQIEKLKKMEIEARRRLDMWNDFLNPGPDIDLMMEALEEIGPGPAGRMNNYRTIMRFLDALRRAVKQMRQAMDINKYGFECECFCAGKKLAYVITNWMRLGWDDDIHFCPDFFKDPETGRPHGIDEMVAAFTHELSHFPGTDDFPGPNTGHGSKRDDEWIGPKREIVKSAGFAELYEEMGREGVDAKAIERRFRAWLKSSVSEPGVYY